MHRATQQVLKIALLGSLLEQALRTARVDEQVHVAVRSGVVARGHHREQPRIKWVAFNAIAEHLDYGRRYTTRTNQVQRSFEDTSLKQRALDW